MTLPDDAGKNARIYTLFVKTEITAMEIRVDDLNGAEIQALLAEHLKCMYEASPPECVHALNVDSLRNSEITFWSIWDGGALAGCGALKELTPVDGEIKSMRTSAGFLGRGVASALLRYIVDEARRRGYRSLSLETGSVAYFLPARNLYKKFGFQECGPFGNYLEDPYSIFMTLPLR